MRAAPLRRTVTGLTVVAILAVVTVVYFVSRPTAPKHPTGSVVQGGGPDFDPIRADEIQTILREDAIPAINRPYYLTATAAADIRDEEQVIGLNLQGDARAFPVATLSAHEIVNDVIGGQPVAVTW